MVDLGFNGIQLKCWLLVLCVCTFSESVNCTCFDTSAEVCSRNISLFPNMLSRDPSILMSNSTSDLEFCDVYAIETQQWYKSESPMSTACPSMYMCGTKFPIWMRGENPEPSEGVANRTACLRDFDTCCLDKYRLTAVNCVDFMAYCIIDLPSSCHQRYCLDLSKPEPTTDTFHTHTTDTPDPYTSTIQRSSDAISTHERTSSDPLTTQTVNTFETDQSTERTTTARSSKDDGDSNKTVIATLLGCMGLLIAAIFGLIVFIIRRKRMQVKTYAESKEKKIPSNDDKNQYDKLAMPEVSFIDLNTAYTSYLKPTEPNDDKSTYENGYDLPNPYQHYQTIHENRSGIFTGSDQDVTEDEERYQTLP